MTRRVDEMEQKHQRSFAKLRRENDELGKQLKRQADGLAAEFRQQADEQFAANVDGVGHEVARSVATVRKDLTLALETSLQSLSEALAAQRLPLDSSGGGSPATALAAIADLQEHVDRVEHGLASKLQARITYTDGFLYKIQQVEQQVREATGAVQDCSSRLRDVEQSLTKACDSHEEDTDILLGRLTKLERQHQLLQSRLVGDESVERTLRADMALLRQEVGQLSSGRAHGGRGGDGGVRESTLRVGEQAAVAAAAGCFQHDEVVPMAAVAESGEGLLGAAQVVELLDRLTVVEGGLEDVRRWRPTAAAAGRVGGVSGGGSGRLQRADGSFGRPKIRESRWLCAIPPTSSHTAPA